MKFKRNEKGVSLPVNLIVILSVSIIVLLAVVAFFTGAWQTGELEEEALRNECCLNYVRDLDGCNQASEYHGEEWGDLDISVADGEVDCENVYDDDEVASDECC